MKRRPPPLAVALRYTGEGAPQVTAKGLGELGERIIARAREHGVALHQDSELAGLLAQIELGAEIPPELYRAVAEVLAFVFLLDGRAEAVVERSGARGRPAPGQ